MKVTLDREGKNVVRVGLEVEADRATRAYEKTCRDLSNHVEIPGFRRGKAPRNIIEKRFGRDAIKQEALERLLPELLQQVITDKKLDIITRPEIIECKFELGEPLTLAAKFEIRPEVKLGTYKGVETDVPEAVIPEDALNKALEGIAEQHAAVNKIDPRKIKMGDHVLLDFECYVEEKLIEGGKAENLPLEIKEGAFVEGFCEQLVGKEPGNEFEVEVTFPEEYRNPELAGKPAKFKVNLKELREKVVPPVDDELAKKVNHESLDELKKTIEAKMDEEIKYENEARAQKAVVDAVVENSDIDIPDTMINREYELLMEQIKMQIQQMGQDWEEFQKMEDFESLRNSKREEASQRVLHSLVLGAVVRAEDMNVTEEEVTPYLNEYAMRNNIPPDRYAEIFQDEYVLRQINEEVLTGKVVDFLVSNAKINYVPDTESSDKKESKKSSAKSAKKEEKAEKTDKADKEDKDEKPKKDAKKKEKAAKAKE
ncbi:trigger factor [bacterium]|nr:trigger factor [bacterium]